MVPVDFEATSTGRVRRSSGTGGLEHLVGWVSLRSNSSLLFSNLWNLSSKTRVQVQKGGPTGAEQARPGPASEYFRTYEPTTSSLSGNFCFSFSRCCTSK